jgi:DNA-binding CsgD family transcriptional regulator
MASPRALRVHSSRHAAAACAEPSQCCLDLLCLLRLSEIVIADPGCAAALPAMVDEIVRSRRVERSLVAVPEAGGGRLRYLAHRGLPGRVAHRVFTDSTTEAAAEAMTQRRIVALPAVGGEPSGGCVTVPILAGDGAIGVLGVRLDDGVPLDAWRSEMLLAVADLMALILLETRRARGPAAAAVPEPSGTGEMLLLTRRQRDVLFELVERGAGNDEIGDALGLSGRTVKIHLQATYRQLGVRSRGEAIRLILTRHADWLARERKRRQG